MSRVDAWLGMALAALLLCGEAAAILALDRLGPGPVAFAASVSTIGAAIVVTAGCIYRRTRGSVSAVLLSPFAVAAGTWIVLFVVRPVELYFFPDHASLALGELGFDSAALTRAVGVAGTGCAAWCAGYLALLGSWDRPARELVPRRRAHWAFGVLALGVGTVLWVALFVRDGGVHALATSAVSVRADQRSSAYGFIGVWIVQGTGLCALAALLRAETPDKRPFRAIVVAAAALSAVAAFALQLRGLAVFAAVSALVIVLALRPPSKRKVVTGAAVAALVIAGLAFAQQVRVYTGQMTTTEAVRTAVRTPIWADFVSDLGTFDNLVAMRELVPVSIPFLNGATIREIPGALVPRRLWPEKPLGVDARVASYLYPGASVAVPISLQGELYWNDGLLAVLVGSLLLGACFGALGRLGLRSQAGSGAFLAYAVALPFTHAFLTRGLAAMTENLVFALVGVFFAAIALGFRPAPAARLRPTPERPSLRTVRSDADA
jgi:hypothetical protein